MPRGGHREGAGRPKGAANLVTKELRKRIDGPKVLDFMQDLALGKIEGATISERKDAAAVLLRKVLPDMTQNKHEIETQEFKPLDIMGTYNTRYANTNEQSNPDQADTN